MKQKILSLLVLLLTAASGAWAQFSTASGEVSSKINTKKALKAPIHKAPKSDEGWYYYDDGINVQAIGKGGGSFYWGIMIPANTTTGSQVLAVDAYDYMAMTGKLLIYNDGNTAPSNLVATEDVAFTGSGKFVTFDLFDVTIDPTKNVWVVFYNESGATHPAATCNNTGDANGRWVSLDGDTWEDIANYNLNYTYMIRVNIEASAPDVEVTTNAASEGATFTEASFQMPASDATVRFKLVRDMEYKVNAYVGDNADATYRHRVELVGNNIYKPKGITNNAQITALFNVVDNIDAENPKTLVYGTDFTVTIVDEDENETNAAEFNFAPGTYTIKVTGKGNYDGVIDSQNAFKLYLGVDITVPAGELVTYYSDETLYTEEEDAVIYTITDVSGTEATATELPIVPANTPFLVKNTADKRKTFLFIVTDGDQLVAKYYPGFTGTLNATTIDASTADQTNYAFNGKEFVYVKNAINIGANKAWLEVANANARAITLVFGDATGVNAVESGKLKVESFYDLNGRKLNGVPTKKGVYIVNGKKVVIK